MNIIKNLKKIFDSFIVKSESLTMAQTKENKNTFDKNGHCIRCNKLSSLDEFGYCTDCAAIKKAIETITSIEHRIAKDTDYLYQTVKEANTYNYSKLDIENAELISNLNGVEKKFLEYMEAKPANSFELAGYWIYEHFIDCNYLISKLIKNGYLEISEYKSLSIMTTDELKNILKKANLKIVGTKKELIQRIEENLNEDEIKSMSENKEKFFVLTAKGKNILQGEKTVIAKDIDFEKNCYNLILNNRLDEAYKLVCEYENSKLTPRGINCDWNNTKKTFHLYIDTELPFKLPKCLEKYEKEVKATAIYTQMMGAGEKKAKSFFVNHYKIDFDKEILDKVFHALCFVAMGVELPEDFNIENIEEKIEADKNLPKSYFENLATEKFIEQLKKELQNAGYDLQKLQYDELKDGTCNFMYEDMQIGRIKFGKKSSSMQIISLDFVDWLKNETMETYLDNIPKWIKYLKEIKAEREKYGI